MYKWNGGKSRWYKMAGRLEVFRGARDKNGINVDGK